MRTIFLALSIPGYEPTAASYDLPTNQSLLEVLQLALALLTQQGAQNVGSAEDFVLWDLYGQKLDPGLLVGHVPFPGCLIVVPRTGSVQIGGRTIQGEEAAVMVAQSIAMRLMTQREDEEDKILTKYARYVRGGAWRFEPTPITDIDVSLTCHAENGALARRLLDLLGARGLRCRARVANADGTSTGVEAGHSLVRDSRALVVMISQSTSADPWLAYDTGAAWAQGIPVVPVLVGEWTSKPPDILSPYQRLRWEKQHDKLVDDLVELLDLTPWSMLGAKTAATEPKSATRAKAPRKPRQRRSSKPSE